MQASNTSNSAVSTGSCEFCRKSDFRRSRPRGGDLIFLLALRWPVRCLHCSKRQYLAFWHARHAMSAKAAHGGEFRSQETWQGYTSRTDEPTDPQDRNDS